MRWIVRPLVAAAVMGLWPALGFAQSFETLGTRAAGMGGAFVGVADDASAVYWNPAGLAKGNYFSLLLDWKAAKSAPNDLEIGAGSTSAGVIALSMPAFGLSYYRLRETIVRPTFLPSPGVPRPALIDNNVATLITHHIGATVVQSIGDYLAVGGTAKLVRGIASSGVVLGADPDDVLDESSDLIGRASNKFDADVGVMAILGKMRAGVTVRNLTEPEFETVDETSSLRLQRQGRAGVAFVSPAGLTVAFDADLNKTPGPHGDVRNIAIGGEAHLVRRVFARAGFNVNSIGDQRGGRAPAVSVGGSYLALGALLVDGQFTTGSEAAGRSWGVAARIVY
jgi:F plasmid transfer operon, TraF, protein